ncbi:SDR family oxidoreductase [Nocardia stercoris]|uniref:NAD-dependent epimerase/dehydratase family protein n=1 Tax=Nocardia stercoris TaxID=2483361 RepID=A0A3M2L575_9NOCA|nr:SDR family oxidoreductase [Nocardia stercoris]RMI31870.1 NAD-dependent epimerase/dehydratase family protein [Nocardia stercoris]
MTQHVLTGATGFVGSHLLAELLAGDPSDPVYALARSNSELPAADRVDKALQVAGFGDRDRSRLTVVESELAEELCGVDPATVERGDGPLIFWHLAASLQWRKGRRDQVFATNVDGTRHALELARSMGADLFVYMSTAYTCGALHGDIPEELHQPAAWSNVYEESKCAAEHLVAGFEGPRTLILRPSVIVGSSVDYKPSGSYTGLYGFLSELRKFKEMLGDSDDSVRFTADRSCRISFIPVDHIVTDSLSIVNAELAEPQRSIYHVTGRSESAVGEFTDYMLKLLGMQDRLYIIDESFDDPSTLERFFDKRIEFFSDYLRKEKRFVRTVPPERSVLLNELTKYIDAENAL